MTLLKIAQLGEPILRVPARMLSKDELLSATTQTFIDDMIETMRDADGAGLAAPQVFRSVRIVVIEVKPNNPRYPYKPAIALTVLVNPHITLLTDERYANFEGCLSVADLRGEVQRCPLVRVNAWDRNGQDVVIEAKGISAGTYQHECDHLDGMIFVDRANPRTFTTWKNFDKHHKAAFVPHAEAVVQRFGG
jgi:peptide deformylase